MSAGVEHTPGVGVNHHRVRCCDKSSKAGFAEDGVMRSFRIGKVVTVDKSAVVKAEGAEYCRHDIGLAAQGAVALGTPRQSPAGEHQRDMMTRKRIVEAERPGSEMVGHDDEERASATRQGLDPAHKCSEAAVGIGKGIFGGAVGEADVGKRNLKRFVAARSLNDHELRSRVGGH